MGQDKAWLRLGNQTLLERSLALAATVAAEVRIAGSAQMFSQFGEVVDDVYPGCGPLAGIHAALVNSAAELNLMLAVDMPFVQSGFLEYLLSVARENRAWVTLPRAAGRWQPLCAVYRRAFAAVAEAALRKGNNRVDALFAQVETHVIPEEEFSRRGFPVAMFRNLNTPEDFDTASAL